MFLSTRIRIRTRRKTIPCYWGINDTPRPAVVRLTESNKASSGTVDSHNTHTTQQVYYIHTHTHTQYIFLALETFSQQFRQSNGITHIIVIILICLNIGTIEEHGTHTHIHNIDDIKSQSIITHAQTLSWFVSPALQYNHCCSCGFRDAAHTSMIPAAG